MYGRIGSFAVAAVFQILFDAQNLRYFFLSLNDDLGLSEFVLQALVFPFQVGHTFVERILRLGFSTSLCRCEAIENALIALFAPAGKVGGIQPLLSKQGTDLTRLSALVGLFEDAQLIGGGKPSTGF
jgi:hypothetical protein